MSLANIDDPNYYLSGSNTGAGRTFDTSYSLIFRTLGRARFLGPIAQLAEHSADNAGVRGAIPLWPTIFFGVDYEISVEGL